MVYMQKSNASKKRYRYDYQKRRGYIWKKYIITAMSITAKSKIEGLPKGEIG